MMSYKYQRNFVKAMNRNKHYAEWIEFKSQCLNYTTLAVLKSIVLLGKLHLISDKKTIKSRLIKRYISWAFNLASRAKYARYDTHSFIKAMVFTMNRFNERVEKQTESVANNAQ